MVGISVFWVGLSAVSDGVTTLVLPRQIDSMVPVDDRATALGIVSFVGLFAAMVIQPLAGLVSDMTRIRHLRRGWIGLSTVAVLISLLGLGLAMSLGAVLFAFLAIQMAVSSAQAGQQGLIPDLVADEDRGLASGWKGFADVGGSTIGFVVVGGLLEAAGVAGALAASGVLLVATYVLMVLLGVESRSARTPALTGGSPPQLRNAYRIDFLRNAVFVRVVWARFAFLLGIFGVGRFLLFYADERLGLGTGETGALLGLFALVTVAASPLFGWLADRRGRLAMMRTGVLLAATGIALFIPAASMVPIVLGGSLMGLGSAAFGSGNWAATTDVLPTKEAGRFMGIANFGTAGASAAAGLFGPLIDAVDRISSVSRFDALFVFAIVSVAASAMAISRTREAEPGNLFTI
jgi:MFS family permease